MQYNDMDYIYICYIYNCYNYLGNKLFFDNCYFRLCNYLGLILYLNKENFFSEENFLMLNLEIPLYYCYNCSLFYLNLKVLNLFDLNFSLENLLKLYLMEFDCYNYYFDY